MIEHLSLPKADKANLLTMMENVCYTNRPYWYGNVSQPMMMDIVLPAERRGTPRPVLLFCCGGAFEQTSRSVWMPEIAWYARHGYVVACMDYRIGVDAPWPGCVQDAKAAVRFLKAHAADLNIDPCRIAIMGESAGGYIASMTGVTADEPEVGDWSEQSSAVQAVVDVYGKVSFGEDPALTRRTPFLSPLDTTEKLKKASVVPRVTPDTPPFFIMHGSEDPLVPIGESEELYAALEKAGVYAEFCILDGVGHGDAAFYSQPMRERVLAFLNKVL